MICPLATSIYPANFKRTTPPIKMVSSIALLAAAHLLLIPTSATLEAPSLSYNNVTSTLDLILARGCLKVGTTGEKYDVPALKNLAREKFERACKKYWADAQFPIAASHSLSTTPDSDNGLRDVLCTTMIENHELFKNEVIKMLLIEYPRFTFAVVERLAAKVSQITDR
jgi:hypothetical protein